MAEKAKIISLPEEENEKIKAVLKQKGADDAPVVAARKVMLYIDPPGVCMEVNC